VSAEVESLLRQLGFTLVVGEGWKETPFVLYRGDVRQRFFATIAEVKKWLRSQQD
jgi:hypothetical protein